MKVVSFLFSNLLNSFKGTQKNLLVYLVSHYQ